MQEFPQHAHLRKFYLILEIIQVLFDFTHQGIFLEFPYEVMEILLFPDFVLKLVDDSRDEAMLALYLSDIEVPP